jgi:hypothetical protein
MSDGTWDDYFVAGGGAGVLRGFDTARVTSNDGHTPVFDVGVVGVGRTNGVWGHAEQTLQFPPRLVSGVFGSGIIQPGVIGFSRESDGVQALSFTGTCLRAASMFGRGVHSISGALSGVTGISNTEGPAVPNIANIAGVVGSSGDRPGVLGTSKSSPGIFGFSSNGVGVVGQTTNDASFAGAFAGNVIVSGTLTASVKNAVVPFPDGSQRVMHCMESPEHWFEDFGSGKLNNGRAVVKLDADFAKVVKLNEYHVFVMPEGDCRGLSVRNKTATTFEVRELTDGKSSVTFSYRIVARRKDIKAHRRFDKIDMRLPVPTATRATRKAAPSEAQFRAFVARLEKEARAPTAARRPRTIRARTWARISAPMREQLTEEPRFRISAAMREQLTEEPR